MESSAVGPSDDPKMAELWLLYESKEFDWEGVLAGCRELLKLMPAELVGEGVPRRDKGLALKAALYEVIDHAYQVCRSPGENILEKKALAGAVAIGLIDGGPDDLANKAALQRAQKWLSKGKRLENAGKWYPARVGARRFKGNYLVKSLQALCDSLEAALQDDGFIQAIAAGVGKPFAVRNEVLSTKAATTESLTCADTDANNTDQQSADHALTTIDSRVPITEPECSNTPSVDDELSVACSVAARLLDVTPYVRRSEAHDRFDSLIKDKHRVIVIVGDRGNGKSRFALEVARHQANKSVFLDATTKGALSRDLTAVLVSKGIQAPTMNNDPSDVGLASVVSGPDRPPYVILDNAVRAEVVTDMLPGGPQAIVIITGTDRIPSYEASTIDLDAMDTKDADKLARSILDNKRQAALLANVLHGRPLAIVQVCSMVKLGLLEPNEFVRELKANASNALRVVRTQQAVALSVAYRRVLQASRAHVPLAAEILERVAFVAHEHIPMWLIRGSLQGEVDGVEFGLALEYLRNISLVNVIEGELSVHPLTRQILHSLLVEREQEICETLHRLLAQRLKKVSSHRLLPPEIAALIPHAFVILRGLSCGTPRTKEIGHTLAIVIAGLRQFGDLQISSIGTQWDELAYAGGSRPCPELAEALVEWLAYEFDAGVFDARDYCDALCRVLRARYGADDYLDRLEAREHVDLARAATWDGRQELLRSLLLKDRFESDFFDDIDRGDLFLLHGDFKAETNSRESADYFYFFAQLMYHPAGADDYISTRVSRSFLAAKRQIQNQLKVGKYNRAASILEVANENLEADPSDTYPDVVTHARHMHMTASIRTDKILEYAFIHGWSNECNDLADSCATLLNSAMTDYNNSGANKEYSEAELDALYLVGARFPARVSHPLVNILTIPGAEGEGFHADCVGLGMAKLLFFWRGAKESPYDVDWCKDLAHRFAAEHQSLYWHAEALVVAWVIASRTGWSEFELASLENAAEDATKEAHRHNRFMLIRELVNDERLRYVIFRY